MLQRGIRGAVTLENNSESEVKEAVFSLIKEITVQNNLKTEDISHVIFTMTSDLDCVYPAKAARELFSDWKYVPMMCVSELDIKDSIKKMFEDSYCCEYAASSR